MPTFGYVEYQDAGPEVKAVYDDIMASRGVDWISNFWKSIAHDPALLRRTWQTLKEIMQPGALDSLTKEMLYLAVSASNQCHYCIASHTAASWKAGMNDAMFGELMSIVGMANETNRLVSGYQVEIDERFKVRGEGWKKYPEPGKVVEQYFAAFNENRPEGLDAVISPDFRGFDGDESSNPEGLKAYLGWIHSAIGDYRFAPAQWLVSGEWVSVHGTTSGVQKGNFLGIPASGKQFAVSGMAMFRVVQGRITEVRAQWDTIALQRQLSGDAPNRLPE